MPGLDPLLHQRPLHGLHDLRAALSSERDPRYTLRAASDRSDSLHQMRHLPGRMSAQRRGCEMNIKITIDGREVEVAEGQTLLEAARKLGIDIPTLCFLERCGPMTSCLVCIVKLKFNGRTSVVPSC